MNIASFIPAEKERVSVPSRICFRQSLQVIYNIIIVNVGWSARWPRVGPRAVDGVRGVVDEASKSALVVLHAYRLPLFVAVRGAKNLPVLIVVISCF